MLPNVIDIDELVHEERREGMHFAFIGELPFFFVLAEAVF
jgi:Na+/melibiose symporter-like transporter